jgi:hypothetical protein
MQLHGITEDLAIPARSSVTEILEDVPELEALSRLNILQHLIPGLRTAAQPEIARRSGAPDLAVDRQALEHLLVPQSHGHGRLLNARQVAEKLGVSERWGTRPYHSTISEDPSG